MKVFNTLLALLGLTAATPRPVRDLVEPIQTTPHRQRCIVIPMFPHGIHDPKTAHKRRIQKASRKANRK